MSQTVITTAFEQWKAAQAANGQAVVLDEFVFANVPGLDVNAPINRAEVVPPAAQIVYRQAVEKTGLVNQNAVVYSVTLGADVGDFSFNWIGLINKATGKLAMVVHAPLQSKVKNANGQQGNVLTRSFLMEYNGAEAQTLISTPAETWQIDFTARLAGMDESLRLANLDIYGAGAFFDNGFLVAKTGTQYYVTAGLGYVGGLRANLAAKTNITVTTKPMKVWADVSYHGTLTSEYKTDIKFTLATALKDYVQSGIAHYVFALASIDANGVITDLRPQGSSQYLRRDKNLTDISDPEAALNTLNGVPKTRKINKKALSDDFDLTAADVGALPVIPGVLGTININTLNLANIGVYVQSTGANATVANGYPPGSQAAGLLEVIPASWTGGVLQRYTVQNTGMVWTRALNASWNGTDGPWRDWVQASAVNSVTVPSAILTTTDINTLGFASGTGNAALYAQPKNANATAALHYPQGIAGTLYVTPSAYGCQQMYITFTGNIWNRGLSGDWNGADGPWKEWVPTYSANNKPTAADVGAWTAAQSAASEKALADEIGTAFKIRANLTATDSPNTLRGSAMFGHYGVPGAAAATTDKGYPMNGFVGVIFVTWGPNATQQIAFNNNGRQFTRGASGAWNGADGPWTNWNEIYCQANKPTPADVGALPAGGTAVAATKLATARKIAGVAFDGTADINLSNANVGLGNVGNFAAVQQGGGAGMQSNKVYIGWTGSRVKIQVDASDMGEVYTTNFPPPQRDSYTKAETNDRFLMRDGATYAGFAAGDVTNPYMRHLSSNAVVSLATRDWSDSRFIYDVQRGSQALENAGWTTQTGWEAPTGCFMTGLSVRPDLGDARTLGKYYRALMVRTASGSWRQVGN